MRLLDVICLYACACVYVCRVCAMCARVYTTCACVHTVCACVYANTHELQQTHRVNLCQHSNVLLNLSN